MNEQDYRHIFHQISPDPGQVDRLCAQTAAPRRKGRGMRPILAAALCAALVLCLTNYSAIAAGVQHIITYVSGIGAVAQSAGLLVQGEPIRWDIEEEQETWIIEGSLLRDGVLYVHAASLSKLPAEHVHQSGSRHAQLKLEVSVNGIPLQSVSFGPEGETSRSNYTRQSAYENFGSSGASYGNDYWQQRFAAGGYVSCAGFLLWSFQVPEDLREGPFQLTLSEYQVPESFTYTDTLVMARPELVDMVQSTRNIGEGAVTLLVSAGGRSAALYGELDPEAAEKGEYLFQLTSDHGVCFVDEAGNRYQGVVRPLSCGNGFMPEYCLLQEPEAPIVRVELSDIRYNIGSARGGQRYPGYTDLDWTVIVPKE